MSNADSKRLQEGALSALKTPTKPPEKPQLIPLTPLAPKTAGGEKGQ